MGFKVKLWSDLFRTFEHEQFEIFFVPSKVDVNLLQS